MHLWMAEVLLALIRVVMKILIITMLVRVGVQKKVKSVLLIPVRMVLQSLKVLCVN